MVYLDPAVMSAPNRDLFLEWLANEGLDASLIANNGTFSVHKGRIAGEKVVYGADSQAILCRDGVSFLTTHFNVAQQHELPQWDTV